MNGTSEEASLFNCTGEEENLFVCSGNCHLEIWLIYSGGLLTAIILSVVMCVYSFTAYILNKKSRIWAHPCIRLFINSKYILSDNVSSTVDGFRAGIGVTVLGTSDTFSLSSLKEVSIIVLIITELLAAGLLMTSTWLRIYHILISEYNDYRHLFSNDKASKDKERKERWNKYKNALNFFLGKKKPEKDKEKGKDEEEEGKHEEGEEGKKDEEEEEGEGEEEKEGEEEEGEEDEGDEEGGEKWHKSSLKAIGGCMGDWFSKFLRKICCCVYDFYCCCECFSMKSCFSNFIEYYEEKENIADEDKKKKNEEITVSEALQKNSSERATPFIMSVLVLVPALMSIFGATFLTISFCGLDDRGVSKFMIFREAGFILIGGSIILSRLLHAFINNPEEVGKEKDNNKDLLKKINDLFVSPEDNQDEEGEDKKKKKKKH